MLPLNLLLQPLFGTMSLQTITTRTRFHFRVSAMMLLSNRAFIYLLCVKSTVRCLSSCRRVMMWVVCQAVIEAHGGMIGCEDTSRDRNPALFFALPCFAVIRDAASNPRHRTQHSPAGAEHDAVSIGIVFPPHFVNLLHVKICFSCAFLSSQSNELVTPIENIDSVRPHAINLDEIEERSCDSEATTSDIDMVRYQ